MSEPAPENHKPARKWRGYLKEYAIIVVGVLTALAAQQAAEALHWQNEVTQARKTLAVELAFDDIRLARRVAYQPCMNRQINEAEAIIADLEAGRAPRTFTALHTGIEQLFDDSQWQSLRASQVLTHFPDAELALMARYYSNLDGFRLWMDHEGYAWADLSVLRNPPRGLTASDFLRLRASLSIARRMNALTVTRAQITLPISRQLGIGPPIVSPERVEKFCTLSDAEFAAWQGSSVNSRP